MLALQLVRVMCVLVFLENGLVPTLALACMRAGPRKFSLQMHPVSAMFAHGLHRKNSPQLPSAHLGTPAESCDLDV